MRKKNRAKTTANETGEKKERGEDTMDGKDRVSASTSEGVNQQEASDVGGELAAAMAKNEALQARIEALELAAWVDTILHKEGARNPKAVRALLHLDAAVEAEEVKRQVDEIKKSDSYLFYETVEEGRFGQTPAESRERADDAFLRGFGR